MYRFLLFLIGLPLLIACGQAPSEAQTPRAGEVVGRVVDDNGRPIAGAEVYLNYDSSVVTMYGKSTNVTVYTGKDGRYRASLRNMPPGQYSATATAILTIAGKRQRAELIPENPAPFASNDAVVRNFRYGTAESTDDNPQYGVGGMLIVDDAIGEYLPMQKMEVTLVPKNGGAAIRRGLKQTGEGWIVSGLPANTDYDVSVRLNGRTLKIRKLDAFDDPYRSSYLGRFERFGPDIYQIKVEVSAN